MVLGVSTRRYARSLEPLPAALAARATSKSAVSERFVYGTERKLGELLSRDLHGLKLVALMIDGVHFGEHVVLVAVGVDERGHKHVLGLREGATENAAAVKTLLADLVERGLDTGRALLVVIDGAKALHKAVAEVFGRRALIQRCREHKKRNVTEALPERLRAGVRGAMVQAYAARDAKRARRLLENWSYPVSVEGVGLGDWFRDCPISLSLMLSCSSPIFSAASGGGADCLSGPWSLH